jgi:hypothetical protein
VTRDRIAENPFFVLGLEPECSRLEMERQGQKLLAMLEVGFAEATRYATPFGERTRDAEAVRAAMAHLRDPRRRLVAELWARAPVRAAAEAPPLEGAVNGEPEAPARTGWRGAVAALGWGRAASREEPR